MLNVNRVTLLGHVWRDPELHTSSSGDRAARFSERRGFGEASSRDMGKPGSPSNPTAGPREPRAEWFAPVSSQVPQTASTPSAHRS